MTRGPRRDDAYRGFGTAWAVIGTMLAGLVVWGGLGWLVDRLAGTTKVFLPIGLVLGAVGGIYLVYVRYGRDDQT